MSQRSKRVPAYLVLAPCGAAVALLAAAGATPSPAPATAGLPVAVIVAVITAIGSLIGAVVAALFAARSAADQRSFQAESARKQEAFEEQTAAKQRDHDVELANLKQRFDEGNAELESQLRQGDERFKAALAELAAKRRLLEALQREANGADERIRWIAARARDGRLAALLGNNRYDWKLTIYAIMAPVVLADLLGTVDPLDDQLVARRYALARSLRALLSSDAELAKAAGLEYRPGRLIASDASKTKENFRIFDVQGVELLHEVVELFRDPQNDPPIAGVQTFIGKFSTDAAFDQAIQTVGAVLRDFQPGDKPVFWTLLIAYAYIAQALDQAFRIDDLAAWVETFELDRSEYDTGVTGQNGSDLFAQSCAGARAWLAGRLADRSPSAPREPQAGTPIITGQ